MQGIVASTSATIEPTQSIFYLQGMLKVKCTVILAIQKTIWKK